MYSCTFSLLTSAYISKTCWKNLKALQFVSHRTISGSEWFVNNQSIRFSTNRVLTRPFGTMIVLNAKSSENFASTSNIKILVHYSLKKNIKLQLNDSTLIFSSHVFSSKTQTEYFLCTFNSWFVYVISSSYDVILLNQTHIINVLVLKLPRLTKFFSRITV